MKNIVGKLINYRAMFLSLLGSNMAAGKLYKNMELM